jgi:hypothetical protein
LTPHTLEIIRLGDCLIRHGKELAKLNDPEAIEVTAALRAVY